MVAPTLPGKYCAFFRFVHGENQRFGQKVWCDLLVEDSNYSLKESKVILNAPVDIIQQESSLLNESE